MQFAGGELNDGPRNLESWASASGATADEGVSLEPADTQSRSTN